MNFRSRVLLAVLVLAFPGSAFLSRSQAEENSASISWDSVPGILAKIIPPKFPARDFDVAHYGGVADGKTDNTAALAAAIAACNAAGGGRVTVTEGTVLTGAVHLRSNVNLYIAQGATLKFMTDPAKYLPLVYTRFEGTECMNYSPFIYAFEQENLAVTGEGTLDGSASDNAWWDWRVGSLRAQGIESANKLVDLGERGVAIEQRRFGPAGFLRPNFIQFYRCKNILVEDVQIIRSPMWEIHPVLSTNITVRGVKISTHGPNNDGCNPECSRDVLIENCLFDTGDDCIAIKSGKNNDGRRVNGLSENLIIRNCTMKDGHGGIVFGSEITGGCRNVFIENCTMDSARLDRALRFKSNAQRGGVVENIFMRNVQIGQVAEAIVTVDFEYDTGPVGDYVPVVRNVHLENVTSRASPRVLWVQGVPQGTIDDIFFANCTFRGLTGPEVVEHAGKIIFDHVTIEPAQKSRSLNSITANQP